jgi:hypothetical protein
VAESPVKAGMIWAGTDDGNLQLTTDGGKAWKNVAGNLKDVPRNSPVSHIEPSRAGAEIAYVAFDRHMFDDFRPYIYRTADAGATWTSISGNLPEKAHVHVVREDPKRPGLLYAGTELGLYASYDGGRSWSFLKLKNLPPVPVHDIQVHPRENDLILATHGRSVVILDDAAAVQEWNPDVAQRDLHLFEIRPALRFTSRMSRYGLGGAQFKGPNPPYGALITYYLKQEAEEKSPPKLQILDASGKVIRSLEKVPREKGVQRVAWDLRADPPAARKPPEEEEEVEFDFAPKGIHVLPGTYTVKLTLNGKSAEKKVDVRMDPAVNVSAAELRSRYELATRLRDMVDEGNRTLKTLDSLARQLGQTGKLLKEQAPEKAKASETMIATYRKEVEKVTGTLGRQPDAPRLETGPVLVEKIESLYTMVENANAAPTPYQQEAFKELSPLYTERMQAAREFLSRTVPDWNQVLVKAGLPQLVTADK